MFQVVRGGRIAIGAATLAQDSKKLGGKYVEDRGFLQQAGQLSFHNRKYRSPIVPAPVVFNLLPPVSRINSKNYGIYHIITCLHINVIVDII